MALQSPHVRKLTAQFQDLLVKQCDDYIKEREDDLCELHDRISAIKEDLKDPTDVFQFLHNSTRGTHAGDHFLSILQHLLFIRDQGSAIWDPAIPDPGFCITETQITLLDFQNLSQIPDSALPPCIPGIFRDYHKETKSQSQIPDSENKSQIPDFEN